MGDNKTGQSGAGLRRVVEAAKQSQAERERGYREQALKLYPWVCGRCGREFNPRNLSQLTVHHRDHNHDNNPSDGSNWELLCLFCHDNEHSRYVDTAAYNPGAGEGDSRQRATHQPFADLKALLDKGKGGD